MRTGKELAEHLTTVYRTIIRISSLRPALLALPLIKRVIFTEERLPKVAFVLPDGTVVASVPHLIECADEYYKVFTLTRIPISSPIVAFMLWVLTHEITHILFRHYERVNSLIRKHDIPLEIAIVAAEMECNAIVSQMLPCPPGALMPQEHSFAINASLEEMALQLYQRAGMRRCNREVFERVSSAWGSLADAIKHQIEDLSISEEDEEESEIGGQEKREKRGGKDKNYKKSDLPGDMETEEQELESSVEDNEDWSAEEDSFSAKAGEEQEEVETVVISVDSSVIDKVNQSMEMLAESLQQWKLNEVSPSFFLLPQTDDQTPSVFSRVPSIVTSLARKRLSRISKHYAGWGAGGDDIDVPTDPIGNVIRIISRRLVETRSRSRTGLTWTRPSRRLMRWYAENKYYMPDTGNRGERLGIVVDTSGSMWEIVDKAIGLAYGAKGDDVWVVPCDVVGYTPFRAKERRNKIPGTGGTYLWNGVRTLYDRKRFPFLPEQYSTLIIISDGQSNLPTEEEVMEFWKELTQKGIPLPDRYFVALVYSEDRVPDLSFWTRVGFRSEIVVISALR